MNVVDSNNLVKYENYFCVYDGVVYYTMADVDFERDGVEHLHLLVRNSYGEYLKLFHTCDCELIYLL